ncbi:hypothetical protein GGR51DRAFT_561102 [Nemania sp. FL0031]|nr:hypothetical protein GGR51DRAFT_561102 [Nemania sp. FL0031]
MSAMNDFLNPKLLPLPKLAQPLSRASRRAPASGFRPRKGTARARTGCIVCKIRRIKCDEEKPHCRRCTSTGRKCEYSDARPSQPKTWRYNQRVTLPSSMADHALKSREDGQLLHIFQSMTENEVSRHFEPFCWAHLMLQFARVYPSIHYSICAVAALQRAYLHGEQCLHNSQGVLDIASTPLVLARYNMAVKSVSENIRQKTRSLQPVLVCCALFTWLEFLRNNFEAGLRHLRSGLEIIRDWSQASKCTSSRGDPPTEQINENILHLFMRLQTHATAHGYPNTDFHSASSIKLSFNVMSARRRCLSIYESRCLLDNILLKVFRLVRQKQHAERSVAHFESSSPEFTEILRSRHSLLADLSQWQALSTTRFSTRTNGEKANYGTLLLSSYHLMTNIILKTLLAESERAYDDHVGDFSKLVSMSQQILYSASPTSITLDAGVIPLLFFTCLKCRDRSIRTQALVLLRLAPEREGIWHRDSIIAASTLKVALEGNMKTRVYRERVFDASSARHTARVEVLNEATKENVVVEIPGLVSKLGDLV